jgi:hypothetical protein
MRKRSMMSYEVEFDDVGNMIRFHEEYKLDDWNASETIQFARLFQEFTAELKNDQHFKDFVYKTLHVVWEMKPFKEALLTCHAIRTVILQFYILTSYPIKINLAKPAQKECTS